MSKPRVGIAADGVLFPGRLPGRGDLATAPIALSRLIPLIEPYTLVVFPLWPEIGIADFLARWLAHHLALLPEIKDHPQPSLSLYAALHQIEVAERRPDRLDACADFTASLADAGDPLEPSAIAMAIDRGRSLDRAA